MEHVTIRAVVVFLIGGARGARRDDCWEASGRVGLLNVRREVDGVEGDTVAAYLEVIRPDLPPALIGSQALADIEQVAHLLPGALTTFGFECNLCDPEPVADFTLRLPAEWREHMAKKIPIELHDHPGWRQLRTFLDVWGTPRSALSHTVENVYLEFDVSASSGSILAPNIFYDYGVMGLSTAGESRHGQQLAATREAVAILTDHDIDPVVLETLRSCVEALPPGARVAQFAAMIARDTDAFRVCVQLSDPAPVGPYLDRLGWEGERDRLAKLLEELDGRIDYVLLNLDVAASIQPKVGLECYLFVNDTTQRERWEPFLAFLVANDMALDVKCQAVLRYPGHVDSRHEGSRWPPRLRQAADLLHPAALSVFQRSIHHVKLVLEPNRPTEAKAYLAARHLWVTPGSRN